MHQFIKRARKKITFQHLEIDEFYESERIFERIKTGLDTKLDLLGFSNK